jgi:hypothetical protein
MELSEHMSLGDLRNAIKDFKKSAPRLTSKKSDLHAFACKVGLIKKKDEDPAPVAEVSSEKPKKSEKVKVVSSELPEVLKKPMVKEVVKSSKKVVAAPEPAKKKGSPFSSYMSSMKGKGYSMSQLAQMYKDQKA